MATMKKYFPKHLVKLLSAFVFSMYFSLQSAEAQLSKWIVNDLGGNLQQIDFSTVVPTVTLAASGAGSGGNEDINNITDASNNFLFSLVANSTTNMKVMDAAFQMMPNGNGLYGNNSTMQSNIIPKPCDANQYYIVHLEAGTHNLYYSVVDMTLNGGLGDISSANNLINNFQCEGFSCSHQLPTGCRWLFTARLSGIKYVITRYLVSDGGISSQSALDSVALASAPPYYCDLQLSADNTKLAITTLQSSASQPDIIVWDLDLNHGTISNQQAYYVNNLEPVFTIEFSPDANKIFFRTNSVGSEQLGRLNLLSGMDTIVASNLSQYQSHIETAGNGKIYMTNIFTNYLAEIANPDAPNVNDVGYNTNGVYVSASGLVAGLPHAIQGEPPGTTTTPGYIAFSATPAALCNEFQFTDTTCLATWWQWDFGDDSISNLEFPLHQYLTNDTFVVTLKTLTCGDTLSLSQSLIAFSASSATIIQSNDTLYSSPGNSYQWFTGGNAISGATNSFYVPPSEGEYVVLINDSNGCVATDTIFFTLAPQPNFSAADTTICEKFCLDFLDQSTNSPTSWQWIFEGGIPATSNVQNPSQICYNIPGVYDVTLITGNAFGNDTLILSNYITVFATPSFPIITQNGYVLTSSYSGTYQWQFNSVDIPGATNQSYTVTQTGYYTVLISDENGCVNSTTVYVLISGIDEIAEDGILIYPNPSDGQFMVELSNGSMAGEISILVCNSLEQEVFSSREKISSAHWKKEIDLRNATGAIYFLQIKNGSNLMMKKIIIEK